LKLQWLAVVSNMLTNSRTVVTLALVCCILPSAESLAAESRPIDLGLLASLVDNAEIPAVVDSRPNLFPVSVFGISLNEKATFSTATEKLGAATVATKVCREVPWLKASDLHFDKVWLGMTPDKLPASLRQASSGIHDGKFSIEWHGPEKTPASGSGDPAFSCFLTCRRTPAKCPCWYSP
jgi:hypothetical protein